MSVNKEFIEYIIELIKEKELNLSVLEKKKIENEKELFKLELGIFGLTQELNHLKSLERYSE